MGTNLQEVASKLEEILKKDFYILDPENRSEKFFTIKKNSSSKIKIVKFMQFPIDSITQSEVKELYDLKKQVIVHTVLAIQFKRYVPYLLV